MVDQDLTGRRDGENYNCGLVDVADRPYHHQVEAMMETAKRLNDIYNGKVKIALINREYEITLNVTILAKGHTYYILK